MTYEEAHRFLEVKQRDMTQNRHLYNETAIAINGKAIEALEKQIPKKPIIKHYKGYDTYSCPKCDKPFICKDEIGFFAGERSKFCDNCGQALDWSELKK